MSWRDAGWRGADVLQILRGAVLHNAAWKLLSVVAAVGLWLFVNFGERDTEAAFQVPLELRNIPAHLMIVSPRVDFIGLRVSGPRTLLNRIDQQQLSIVLDLSGMQPGPAVFRVRTDALNLPRGVNVVRLNPSEVTLALARVVRKSVPVRLAQTGKPARNLRVTDIKVAPEVVEVIGPADEVARVKVAETVPVDLGTLSAGVTERDVRLETPREYLSFSAALVHAQIRLEEPEKRRVFKGVPVVIRNTAYRTAVTPAQVDITVRGPQSVIESLELRHGAVYIDAAERGPGRYLLKAAVDLPGEVELIRQDPATLRVQISRQKRKADGQ